jgi:hypothetical protein
MRICFVINGQRHCVDVPLLVNLDLFHVPPPENLPELELAATVQELARLVHPVARESELVKELAAVAERYIARVRAELPQGVELVGARGLVEAGRAS